MKKLIAALLVFTLLSVGLYAMTVNQAQTAYQNGDTVYYAPQTVYDYFNWRRATLPGAPFDADTTIPSGVISQMTNNPTVVGGVLVDDWTATVNGTTMELGRLYATEDAFKLALKNALQARIDYLPTIQARDESYIISVDEIGVPVLSVSESTLDFGSVTTELPFDITNTGEGELDWTITTSLPAKVSISPNSGATQGETDTVTVTVDRSGVAQGTYNPTVDVASDGGNASIELTVVVP